MCKKEKVTYITKDEIIYTPETMINDEELEIYSVIKEEDQSDR
ncbi:hypothetical protein [Clostridium sp.]